MWILYFSHKFLPRETRYSTIEKEWLAIKWTLGGLQYYLLGSEFDLETNHQARTWIYTMKDHDAWVTVWYLSLQPFQFIAWHKAGKDNITVDFLSQLLHFVNPGEEGGNETEDSVRGQDSTQTFSHTIPHYFPTQLRSHSLGCPWVWAITILCMRTFHVTSPRSLPFPINSCTHW